MFPKRSGHEACTWGRSARSWCRPCRRCRGAYPLLNDHAIITAIGRKGAANFVAADDPLVPLRLVLTDLLQRGAASPNVDTSNMRRTSVAVAKQFGIDITSEPIASKTDGNDRSVDFRMA